MLLGGNITASASAPELQDQGLAAVFALLRAVVGALGKIRHGTWLHRAVGSEIEVARELISHLIEIVAMARRVIGRRRGKLQRKIAGRSGISSQQAARAQSTLANI